MKRIITGSVTLACTAGIGLASMGTASAAVSSASSTPVIYQALGSWKHPVIRPGYFALGAHFYLSGMHWSRWSASATGHGTDTPGSGHHWASTVTLSGLRSHGGHRYYSAMRITSPGHPTFRLHYATGGWFQS
ncbi:MAG TPA: hypothetical protein VGM79_03365 [Streptosporangiaceae bacterium]|jgi:hypothetical protein